MSVIESIKILENKDEYSPSEVNLAIEVAITTMKEYVESNMLSSVNDGSNGEIGTTGPDTVIPSFLNEKYKEEK